MPNQVAIQSTTQQFLEIFDITNDLVIMKDGATALILTVNAINFGLFAEEEQDAVIYAYAGLLNSLNYPIQIVIRSQTKDVTAYLRLLQDQEEQTANQIQRERIRRYREFVGDLIHEGNVLDKKFYVVIPATALEMGMLPPATVVPGIKKTDVATIERSVVLEKARNILEPKRDHLIGQFARIGLAARQLETQEIIQLFYGAYNPEAAEGQQISDTRSYTTPLVSADVQTNLLSTLQTAYQGQDTQQALEQMYAAKTEAEVAPAPETAEQPPIQPAYLDPAELEAAAQSAALAEQQAEQQAELVEPQTGMVVGSVAPTAEMMVEPQELGPAPTPEPLASNHTPQPMMTNEPMTLPNSASPATPPPATPLAPQADDSLPPIPDIT